MNFLVSGLCIFLFSFVSYAEIQRHRFQHTSPDNRFTRCLRMEALDDDLLHFEIYERDEIDHETKCLREDDSIWISPMVDGYSSKDLYWSPQRANRYEVTYRQNYQGPRFFRKHADGIETDELRVYVYEDSRCVSVHDKIRGVDLTQICGNQLGQSRKSLSINKSGMFNFYGVGNLFTRGQSMDGDWKGIYWDVAKTADRPGNLRGPRFYDGDPSTSQFPMLFSLGRDEIGYGLLMDHPYQMSFDFRGDNQLQYETYGDELRFFVMSGPNLKDLRRDYLELTGKPPVPPKSQLGHWTSRFGFWNWQEVEDEVKALRAANFPLDGVALDLQWFGGRFANAEIFRMGVLQFFAPDFENPAERIPKFYRDYGVHLMPIEESYIDERLDEFRALADANFRRNTPGFSGITDDDGCYLARNNLDFEGGWRPSRIDVDFKRNLGDGQVWWGRGGMLDHSNGHARRYWHQLKRYSLSKMGILNHWLDLGEPEMFYEYAFYNGFPELFREKKEWKDGNVVTTKKVIQQHGDIHNLYNLFWSMGIHEGYTNDQNSTALRATINQLYGRDYAHGPRHWTMSRSGTVGSQRYGAMWTGDTRSNFENLRGQLQSQLHMSLLMDYYGGDAGGFFHLNEGRTPQDPYDAVLYKQWFAAASLIDVPLRPHGWSPDSSVSYGAHRRGHPDSNRANVRRRYEMVPYLYSLSHRAHLFGEPIFPPLVYHFQSDLTVRENGTEKMIGPSLLTRVIADWRGYGNPEVKPHQVPVYLPKGTWVDYESLEQFESKGELTHASQAKNAEQFLNPLFARAGAIIPVMHVDDKTMNVLGKRWGEADRVELKLKVFSDLTKSDFILYEDDGVSRGYMHGDVRQTHIEQFADAESATIRIAAATGSYVGASDHRPVAVDLIVPQRLASSITVNQRAIPACVSGQAENYDRDQIACWFQPSSRLIRMRSATLSENSLRTFQVKF